MIKLENISKIYANGVKAVNDFNLVIGDNEFIVIIGPSGCGKSTTLRMIAGLEEITSGNLYIDNKQVNDVAAKDRNIAMVFQNYALFPHLTVFANMAFGLKLRKTPKNILIERVNNATKMLGIEHLLDRKPNTLSGGEKQRVAIGRALVREPKVFLMDEPLSNLDTKLRVQMRTEISKLYHRLQTTFIYVTHDQIEAMTLGTRIVVMRDGMIQQIDTPQNLYKHPKNLFVAGFIGSPQMNFFDVTTEPNVIKLGEYAIPYSGLTEKPNLILGIRPTSIHVFEGDIFARVELTEHYGTEILLYLRIANTACTASANPDADVKIGDIIKVKFDTSKIHFFDKESGKVVEVKNEIPNWVQSTL